MSGSGIPIPPSHDMWYLYVAGFEAAPPGAVLRMRSAPGNLKEIVGADCDEAIQILYRTTDSNNQPTWAVTTLFQPHTPLLGEKGALLSLQLAYDSANVDNSPSYALLQPGKTSLPTIRDALNMGWFVNVPDFEGPLAAFTAGLQSGYATLDSVRAALSLNIPALGSDPRTAMWGYSGGAFASEWAAELQETYAPELQFAGVALGGLTPNVFSVMGNVNGGPLAALIPAGILGMTSQFPEASQYVLSRLKDTGEHNKDAFLAATEQTYTESMEAFKKQDIFDYFTGGKSDIEGSSLLAGLVQSQGVMGIHGVPRMPLFVYKATKDSVSPIWETDALLVKYCAEGANIYYERNSLAEHKVVWTNVDARAFEFLASVLSGARAIPPGCTSANIALKPVSPFVQAVTA
ncbi:MAG: hypothetical protein Q9165_001096 [Trypethelium subeluteriae]